MLYTVVLVVHIIIAVAIIGLVLIQHGKGADAGAAFGGGGGGASGTVFGASGSANFLSRSTAILATLFFITSISLAYLTGTTTGGGGSVLDEVVPAGVEPSEGRFDALEIPDDESALEGAAETPELPDNAPLTDGGAAEVEAAVEDAAAEITDETTSEQVQ